MSEGESRDPYDTLPRAIAERLAARDRDVPLVTPRVDAEVCERAKAHFSTRHTRAKAKSYRRWAIPAAAAATVLLALLVVRPAGELETNLLRRDDVDGSGRVDILDAFALARRRAADPARIDQSAIDALAARIVALGPAPGAL